MLKNTSLPASPPSCCRIVTNDLFLAAYLLCEGCYLDKVYHNDRSRVSFAFVGNRVQRLKAVYQEGKVSLCMRSFRNCLNFIRDLMHGIPDERSFSCPKEPHPQP